MILVDLAIKSVLAGILGWAAAGFIRRSSASTKHTAAFIALVGVSLLPALAIFLPRWHVPFIRLAQDAAPQSASLPGNAAAIGAAPVQAAVHGSVNFGAVLAGVWLAVAGVLCAATVIRLIRLRPAEQRMTMFEDATIQMLVAQRCRQSGRHVLLLEGQAGETPMTWGHSRPVLLLPSDARAWPEDRTTSVLLHELAHIERSDWLAEVIAQFLCAVNWFNPFVWLIRKRMMIESEAAADDRVLNMGVPATQYASHLVGVTRELQISRMSANVALAMARPGNLDRRVRAILESHRSRHGVRGVATLGFAATVAILVTVVGAAAPTVVKATSVNPPAFAVLVPPDVTIDAEKDSPSEMDQTQDSTIDGPQNSMAESNDGNGDGNQDESAVDNTDTAGGSTASASSSTGVESPTSSSSGDKAALECAKGAAGTTATVPTPPSPAAVEKPAVSKAPPLARLQANFKSAQNAWRIAGRGPSVGAVGFDSAEFERQMKHVGEQVGAATMEALKEVPSLAGVDTKGILQQVLGSVSSSEAKAAIEAAGKITKEQLREIVKQVRRTETEQRHAIRESRRSEPRDVICPHDSDDSN